MIWVSNNWIDKSLLIVFCAIFLNTICSSICKVNAVEIERTNDLLHSQLNESLRFTRSVYEDDFDYEDSSRSSHEHDSIQSYSGRSRYEDSDSSSRYGDRRYDSRDRYNSRHERHYDSRSHGGRDRGNRGKHDVTRKPIDLRMSSIKMPSGDMSSVTDPFITDWSCRKKAKLITFHANGKTVKREYELIANEMEKTKINIADCANRGGCYKSYKILRIQKVINGCLWKRYQDQKKDMKVEVTTDNERLLFHGSTSTEMWDIVNKGIDERNTQAGVYGAGLYFTDKSSGANELVFGPAGLKGCPLHNDKSCTICERKLIICRVNLGKEYNQDGGGNFAHAPVGHHSVVGKHIPTKYTEYIVYRSEQVYPEYVITYKIQP